MVNNDNPIPPGSGSAYGLVFSTFKYWLAREKSAPSSTDIELVEIERPDISFSKFKIKIIGRDLTVCFFNGANAGLISVVLRKLSL